MNIDDIHKIELEITSDCNAACPGCARTQNLDILKISKFGLAELQRLFPDQQHIKDKKFKLCGVLGDPILNDECIDIVDYLIANGGRCQISTNGAYQTAEWWKKLGSLGDNLEVVFCVDGYENTNHIYRVKTNWKVLKRNMQAYSNAGGKGTWMFIVFDHNECDIPLAKNLANELGFKFATRTGMRNSYYDWVSVVKQKNVQTQHIITTSENKEHSKKDQVKKLDDFIAKENKTELETTKIINSISCKLMHEGEIFISSKLELWPCCFLWDSAFKNKENILEKLNEYKPKWNSLEHQGINDVLKHPWFDKILQESWNPKHEKHLSRCIRTCAYNKAYHNEIKVET